MGKDILGINQMNVWSYAELTKIHEIANSRKPRLVDRKGEGERPKIGAVCC